MPAMSSRPSHLGLTVSLSPEAMAELAERVADLLARRQQSAASPWLNAPQAAEYLAAPVSRIRKLTMTGDLRAHREGGRVLYRRDELDEFVRSGGAVTAA